MPFNDNDNDNNADDDDDGGGGCNRSDSYKCKPFSVWNVNATEKNVIYIVLDSFRNRWPHPSWQPYPNDVSSLGLFAKI